MKKIFKGHFQITRKKCAVIILLVVSVAVSLAYFNHSKLFSTLKLKLFPDSDYAYETLPKKPRILVNVHVGKTAGSTMNPIIVKHFANEDNIIINCIKQNPVEFYPYASIRKLKKDFYTALAPHFKPNIMTGGHVGLEVLNFIPEKEGARAFSIVREPKSLMISYYWYVLPKDQGNERKNSNLRDLDNNLLSFIIQTADDNTPPVGWLSRHRNSNLRGLDNKLLSFITRTANYNNSSVRWFSRNNKDYDNSVPITEAKFQEIKNNIKKDFLLVGLTHRFEETLIAFRRLMGWNFDEKLFYKKLNETEFKMPESSYPNSILDSVSERFNFEIRLYNWLEKRFDSLIKLLGPDFDEEVRIFKRLNYLYQRESPAFAHQLRSVQENYSWAKPNDNK